MIRPAVSETKKAVLVPIAQIFGFLQSVLKTCVAAVAGEESAMDFNPLKSGKKVLPVILAGLVASQSFAGVPVDQEKLVAANTTFAFGLMNQIVQARPNANVFISPFSVSSVLQMVNNGAAGQTKIEMQQALKTEGMAAGPLNSAFKDLDAQLVGRKEVTLNLANGLWYLRGYHLKPAFVEDNQKFFQAELAPVDFSKPGAAQIINDWAEKQTKGKIKEVVQFPFPSLTRLILANAIYFKGEWVEPFEKNLTQARTFYVAGGHSKQTPMMVRAGRFNYQETADFQAVKLPYKGGLQMELYLPNTNSNPQKLLAEFRKGGWQKDIQAGYGRREGSVTLPKFKIEFEVILNDPLKALGMKSAFAQNADFSGIADEPLSISVVKQNSFVDVNETGTEAAAVTTVMMVGRGAIRTPVDRFIMILDRPFFFVISDQKTGSILFMGVVNEPFVGK